MKRPATFLDDPPVTLPVTVAYDEDIAADGYINNLTRLWSRRPDVLTSFQDLRTEVLTGSTITAREVAVVVAATAAARGDSYCALAWGMKLAGLTDDETAANVLRGLPADLSPRETALMGWSRQVVRDPNAVTRDDVDGLREAGLDDQEIFEATTWIALRMAFSTVNDALGALPDAELAGKAPRIIRDAVTFGRLP
jgi:uncharacterized peroxidase-related enzyme